jgi:hypothetical protein
MEILKKPGIVFGCFAPTHSQSTSVILPNLIQHLDRMGFEWIFNKHPPFLVSHFQKHENILSINLPGSEFASQIYLGTAESYDNARGREFAGLYCDEVRDFNPEALNVLIGCLRGFGKGVYRKCYTTTPNGFDHIYNEYIAKDRDDIEVIRSCSQDNVFLPQSFFDELKNNYSEKFYQQEVLGQIVNFTIGQCVSSFDNKKHINDSEEVPGEMWLGCDFNLIPMSWTYGTYNRNKVRVAGEIILRDVSRTTDAIAKYISLHSNIKGKRIYIYGDASGNARSTKSNKTDYDIIVEGLKAAGAIPVLRSLKQNPSHVDRINLINKVLEDNRVVFSSGCKQLFQDFSNTVWKPGTKEIWKSQYDCHALDSWSYFMWEEYRPGSRIQATNKLF